MAEADAPQIRKAKRKLLVSGSGGGNHPVKKIKCDYTVVSKDVEEVEYYEEAEDDDDAAAAADCDEIYEDVQLYEENYGFPRQINGRLYYVDLSNFVFDFDSKELIGKLNSTQDNIIHFLQAATPAPVAALSKKKKSDAMDMDGGDGDGGGGDMDFAKMTEIVKII
jgi:hypothetical protein